MLTFWRPLSGTRPVAWASAVSVDSATHSKRHALATESRYSRFAFAADSSKTHAVLLKMFDLDDNATIKEVAAKVGAMSVMDYRTEVRTRMGGVDERIYHTLRMLHMYYKAQDELNESKRTIAVMTQQSYVADAARLRADLDDLQEQNELLTQRLASAEAATSAAVDQARQLHQAEADELKRSLAAATESISQLESMMLAHIRDVEVKTSALASTEEELTHTQEDFKQLQAQLKLAQQEIEQLRVREESQAALQHELEASLVEEHETVRPLHELIASLKEELQLARSGLGAQGQEGDGGLVLGDLNASTAGSSLDASAIGSTSALQSPLTEARARVLEVQAQCAQAEAAVRDRDAQLAQVRSDMAALDIQVIDLRKRDAVQMAVLARYKAKQVGAVLTDASPSAAASSAEERVSVEQQLEAKQIVIEELKQHVRSLVEECDMLRSSHAADAAARLKQREEELKHRASGAEHSAAELALLQTSLKEKSDAVARLEEQVQSLRAEAQQRLAETAALERQVEVASIRLSAAQDAQARAQAVHSSTVADLQSQVQGRTSECALLQGELEQSKKTATELERSLTERSELVRSLHGRIEDLQAQVLRKEEQQSQQQAALNAAEDQLRTLKRREEVQAALIKRLREAPAAATSPAAAGATQELEQLLKAREAEHTAALQQLQVALGSTSSDVTALLASVSSLAAAAKDARRTAVVREKEVARANEKLEAATKRVEEYESERSAQQAAMEQLISQVESSVAGRAEAESRLQQAEQDLRVLRQELEDAKQQMVQAVATSSAALEAQLQGHRSSSAADIEQLQAELVRHLSQQALLEDNLAEREGQIKALEEHLVDKQADIAILSDKMRELSDIAAEASSSAAQLRGQVAQAEEELEQARQQLAAAKQRDTVQSNAVSSLKDARSAQQAEIASMRAVLEERDRQVACTREELLGAQAEAGTLRAYLASLQQKIDSSARANTKDASTTHVVEPAVLQGSIEDHARLVEHLETSLVQARQDAKESAARLSSKEAEHQVAMQLAHDREQALSRTLGQSVARMEEEMGKLLAEIESLRRQRERVEQEAKGKLDALQTELDGARKLATAAVDAQRRADDSALSALRSQCSVLQSTAASAEAKATMLQSQLHDAQAQVQQLQVNLSAQRKSAQEAVAAAEDCRAELRTVRVSLGDAHAYAATLKKKDEVQTKLIASLKAASTASNETLDHQAALARKAGDVAHLTERVLQAEADLQQAREQVSSLTQQAEEHRAALQHSETAISAHLQCIARLEQELSSKSHDVHTLQGQLVSSVKDRDEAGALVTALRQQVSTLTAKGELLEAQVEQGQRRQQGTQDEVTALQLQLQSATSTAASAASALVAEKQARAEEVSAWKERAARLAVQLAEGRKARAEADAAAIQAKAEEMAALQQKLQLAQAGLQEWERKERREAGKPSAEKLKAEYDAQLEVWQRKLDAMRGDLSTARETGADLHQQVQSLTQVQASLKAELEQRTQQHEKVSGEHAALVQQMSQEVPLRLASVNELLQQLQSAQVEITELKAQIAGLQETAREKEGLQIMHPPSSSSSTSHQLALAYGGIDDVEEEEEVELPPHAVRSTSTAAAPIQLTAHEGMQQIASLQSQVGALEQEADSLRARNIELSSDRLVLLADKAKAEAAVAALKATLAMPSPAAAEASRLQAALSKAEHRLEEVSDSLARAEGSAAEASRRAEVRLELVNYWQGCVKGREAEMCALQEEVSTLKTSLQTAQSALAGREAEGASLLRQLNSQGAQVAVLQASLARKDAELNRFERDAVMLTTAAEQARAQVAALVEEQRSQRGVQSPSQTEVAALPPLEEQSNSRENELAEARSRVAELVQKVAAVEAAASAAQADASQAAEDATALRARLGEMGSVASETDAALRECVLKLQKKEAELLHAEHHIARLQGAYKQAKAELKAAVAGGAQQLQGRSEEGSHVSPRPDSAAAAVTASSVSAVEESGLGGSASSMKARRQNSHWSSLVEGDAATAVSVAYPPPVSLPVSSPSPSSPVKNEAPAPQPGQERCGTCRMM